MNSDNLPVTQSIFGSKVRAGDPVTEVVRRIRTAIGLGLLHDGDRLPKELELRTQLGVSAFALRDALSRLRESGLIVTRAGKNGGSFVTYRGDSADLATEELRRMSSTDLRDLGDWRRNLSASAAALAAIRASEANVKRLTSYANQLENAADIGEARRAHGRFHLELAAAAGSARLVRAEFAVHEEIDWLFGPTLAEIDQRKSHARALKAIVNAIATHDADSARTITEQHGYEVSQSLLNRRLGLLAESSLGAPSTSDFEAELNTLMRGIIAELLALAKEIADLFPTYSSTSPGQFDELVASAILRHLSGLDEVVDGLGFLSEVGVLPERPHAIQWWQRGTQGPPTSERSHVLDPDRPDYYDYADLELMARPRDSRELEIAGPYFDYGGVNDYTLTISAPIIRNNSFVGIAAADIRVSDLERRLAPWLSSPSQSIVLLNRDGGVILSNRADPLRDARHGGLHDGIELTPMKWVLLSSSVED